MVLVYTTETGGDPNSVALLTPNQNVERPLARSLTSDDVRNVSAVAGSTVSDALDDIDGRLTPPNGYVERHVYVDPASSRLGTTFAGVVCEQAVIWFTEADMPRGNFFVVDTAAPGGGGSGGPAVHHSTDIRCGTGAGAGARNRSTYARADVIAALPIAIIAGLGGLGTAGAGPTTVSVPISPRSERPARVRRPSGRCFPRSRAAAAALERRSRSAAPAAAVEARVRAAHSARQRRALAVCRKLSRTWRIAATAAPAPRSRQVPPATALRGAAPPERRDAPARAARVVAVAMRRRAAAAAARGATLRTAGRRATAESAARAATV